MFPMISNEEIVHFFQERSICRCDHNRNCKCGINVIVDTIVNVTITNLHIYCADGMLVALNITTISGDMLIYIDRKMLTLSQSSVVCRKRSIVSSSPSDSAINAFKDNTIIIIITIII